MEALCHDNDPCPGCRSVFDRIVVSHLIPGGTRVMWELLPAFTDPNPLEFQLQVGTTSNPLADDWIDVGLPVVNQYVAFDPEQRVWGKTNFTHYRVIVTSPLGTYFSNPVGGWGVLDKHDWLKARAIAREKKLSLRLGPGGQEGYLLKRRWTGLYCKRCLDYQTRECRDPACPECYGTGRQCGYYYPMACTWAALSPRQYHIELDQGQQRGTIDDIVVRADMVMTELLAEEDVWVARRSDDRYYVHSVQHTAEVRGVPVLAQVELRPVPYSSVVYTIPVPQQLMHVEAL